jgi:hypothetical protein
MKTIVLIALLGFGLMAQAQISIGFNYDDNGNQIKRGIRVNGVIERKEVVSNQISDLLKEPVTKTDSISVGTYAIKVYPNPTRGFVNLQIDGIADKDLVYYKLINMQGQWLLAQTQVNDRLTTIDLERMANGIYFLYTLVNGETKIWRLVKE